MHSPLDPAQTNFIDTINDGPDKLDPALFDGPAERIMLGLAAHANTISHARLVALEESFPRTRRHIGTDAFNSLSRDFTETSEARSSDNQRIGATFPAFLSSAGIEGSAIELAEIEWAWLQSYHAAEAEPLTLSELRAFNAGALLNLRIAPHPSAQLVPVTAPLSHELEEIAGTQPSAILALRPAAEVLLLSLEAAQLAVFRAAKQNNATLGNLLSAAIEHVGETASLGPVMDLIGAGALVKTG